MDNQGNLEDMFRKLLDTSLKNMEEERELSLERYRRQDEIGTPFCITFDYDSIDDNAVTVRDRDSMTQERIAIDQLQSYFLNQFGF